MRVSFDGEADMACILCLFRSTLARVSLFSLAEQGRLDALRQKN